MRGVKRTPSTEELCAALKMSVLTKERFVETHGTALLELGEGLANRLADGAKLLVAGNGGSASDAQHFAAELVGRFSKPRGPLPCLALPANIGLLTAIGNDFGFERVFERQIEAFGRKGDAFLAISTSGNSPNVVLAAKKAKELGLFVVGLTGFGGGSLKEHVHVLLDLPFEAETPRVQEAHIFALHALAWIIEESLAP